MTYTVKYGNCSPCPLTSKRHMFWLPAPFLVGEREPHCVLERAIRFNALLRELLEPRGWIEVSAASIEPWALPLGCTVVLIDFTESIARSTALICGTWATIIGLQSSLSLLYSSSIIREECYLQSYTSTASCNLFIAVSYPTTKCPDVLCIASLLCQVRSNKCPSDCIACN